MSKQISKKPVAIAMGAALAGGLLGAGVANAAENPFGLAELNGGYMQTAAAHMEGKCGGNAEAKAEEGKCGGMAETKPKAEEGKCGGKPAAKPATKEGSCGENKCGANK